MILNNMNQIVLIDKDKAKDQFSSEIENNANNENEKNMEINKKHANPSTEPTSSIELNQKITRNSNFFIKKKEDFNKNHDTSKDVKQNELSQYKNLFYSKSLDFKRKKSPIKGLAFRETIKNDENSNEYSRKLKKIQSEIGSYNNFQDYEFRPSYKDMVKKIRKGINSYNLQRINISSIVYNKPNLNKIYLENRKSSVRFNFFLNSN